MISCDSYATHGTLVHLNTSFATYSLQVQKVLNLKQISQFVRRR